MRKKPKERWRYHSSQEIPSGKVMFDQKEKPKG
jgi:hypothetical protein